MATFANKIGGNSYQVKASEAEQKLRAKEPLLLHKEERVILAFKNALDPRDKDYLTTHRILVKDGKGIGGKRKNFKSIPYASIQSYSVQTAGAVLDGDTELRVYSNTADSSMGINFGKGVVDLWQVQQFMNEKVLGPPKNDKDNNNDDDGSSAFTPREQEQQQKLVRENSSQGLLDWLGDNAKEISKEMAEQKFKHDTPVLRQDETIELAYKSRRDFTIFTNLRIFIVDVKGLFGQKVEFLTVMWNTIGAYKVQTAGGFLDRDTDMCLCTNILRKPYIEQDFREGKADLWAIYQNLNQRFLDTSIPPAEGLDLKEGHVDPDTSFWGRSDNRPLDAVAVNQIFHTSPPILLPTEQVEMAFKGRRDSMLFTNYRVVKVDRRGISGKSVEYTSIPWQCIIGFAVETGGKHFDNDSEAHLYTELMYIPGGDDEDPKPGMAMWEIDFNKKMVDILAIKRYLTQRCMYHKFKNNGVTPTVIAPPPPNVGMTSTPEVGLQKLWSKIGDDYRAIDPIEFNTELHTNVPILMDGEHVVMAFKCGRDAFCFTNYRVVEIDVKGWSGEKIEYLSIPYDSIRAFSCESAGGFDRDSELDLYTRNLWSIGKKGFDFRKGKVDISIVQKFMSAIIVGTSEDAAKYLDIDGGSASTSGAIIINNNDNNDNSVAGFGSFMAWLTKNSVEVDAEATTLQLKSNPPILLSHEFCERVYRSGRDLFVYTNLRILLVDVQGLRGKKVEYLTIPLKWLTGFEVETAGHLDPDAEVYIHFDIPTKSRLQQDILIERGDVMDVHKYLTDKVFFPTSSK